uniref:Uncharacterized protein n=1 Tax=Anguilla anguilla TaxID=7936 RepID=A0A0E9TL29_ANGAN
MSPFYSGKKQTSKLNKIHCYSQNRFK